MAWHWTPLFVLPCFVVSRLLLPLSPFFSLHFGSSSVLPYPSSALISLPTGTSGSIFGWWAAEGLKHRVSQLVRVCVCGWCVRSNWFYCSPHLHLFLFFSVCVCMCVWHQVLMLCWGFVLLCRISLRIIYLSVCVFDQPVMWVFMHYVCAPRECVSL